MNKNLTIITRILSIVLALVMLAVVALQFIPAWELEEESMSVAEYVWFPYKTSQWHPNSSDAFTKFFRGELGDDLISAGDIAGGHVILLVLGILGAVFCITKGTKRLPFILGAVMGLFGLYEYFMQPLYVLTPLGMPLLALCGVIAAVSIAGIVLTYVNKNN